MELQTNSTTVPTTAMNMTELIAHMVTTTDLPADNITALITSLVTREVEALTTKMVEMVTQGATSTPGSTTATVHPLLDDTAFFGNATWVLICTFIIFTMQSGKWVVFCGSFVMCTFFRECLCLIEANQLSGCLGFIV